MRDSITKKILMKRVSSMLDHKNYEFECMSYSDLVCLNPKDEDIPSIVQSVIFWQQLIIPNPKSPIEHKQNKISAKNANCLLNVLKKSKKISISSKQYIENEMYGKTSKNRKM